MTGWTDKRPMSPHLWQWRWHITMAGSILHRLTGIGLYVGAFVVVGWLFAAALGREAYDAYAATVGSIPGQVVLFGFVLAIVYHALNGVRHLFWDAGYGFRPQFANFTGWLVLFLSVVGAVAIWVLAGFPPTADLLNAVGVAQVKQSIRTPLGKVRGLGAAKEGVHHFIALRVASIALLFLLPWLLISLVGAVRGGYDGALDFIAQPLNGVLILLTVGAALYHMRLGMEEVINDYLAKPFGKFLALILNNFVSTALFAAAAFAVLTIAT